MELYNEILVKILEDDKSKVIDDIKMSADQMVEMKCYITLLHIKEILDNHELDDKECFMAIEKIVCLFEELGSGLDYRHDFG